MDTWKGPDEFERAQPRCRSPRLVKREGRSVVHDRIEARRRYVYEPDTPVTRFRLAIDGIPKTYPSRQEHDHVAIIHRSGLVARHLPHDKPGIGFVYELATRSTCARVSVQNRVSPLESSRTWPVGVYGRETSAPIAPVTRFPFQSMHS